MAVEIREIIIRTEITPAKNTRQQGNEKELNILKKQLLEACRAMLLKEQTRKNNDKR